MQWIRDYKPDLNSARLFRQALVITLVGNLMLAVGKGVAAYFSGSVALYADAANSVSDVLYSLLMILGLWMAQQPPDIGHPQGHGRFEPIVGLMVASAMTFAGYEAGRTSIERFLVGGTDVVLGWPVLALLASAAVKALMYGAIRRIAVRVASPALAVVAQDNLSDVLTSAAAFVGVFGSRLLHPLADPIAGVLVALWIFRAALGAWKENLRYLTGAGASREIREEIAALAATIPGVLSVHQVITEYVGPRLVADLHIDVDGNTPLFEVHRISDAVRVELEALPEVDRVYVHVEPSAAS
ncbi:MAG: cation diffusion facilitator family transporter [Anaerolineae bacterium]